MDKNCYIMTLHKYNMNPESSVLRENQPIKVTHTTDQRDSQEIKILIRDLDKETITIEF